jgi:hypothetical protein
MSVGKGKKITKICCCVRLQNPCGRGCHKRSNTQPYLLERKKYPKWYVKLFKMLFNAAIHNAIVTC